MATTTVRIDVETHARLTELSERSGTTLMDTVRQAAEALRRQQFARQVTEELAQLAQDQSAWTAYLDDADDTAVTDGLS